jgi:hypothetical protein
LCTSYVVDGGTAAQTISDYASDPSVFLVLWQIQGSLEYPTGTNKSQKILSQEIEIMVDIAQILFALSIF